MAQSEDIRKLLLSADEEDIREGAYAAGEAGLVEAVDLLVECLKSGNLGVQEAADDALRKIGGAKVVHAVSPLLRSDDPPTRNLAMDILRAVGAQDMAALVELLKDHDADVRIFASDILGSAGEIAAVQPLCDSLLKDPEVNVRYQAAVSLGELGFPQAAGCLNKALGDEEWVQFSVIEALIKIRDESSVGALLKALDKSSDLVASMIVDALGEMGNLKAGAMLLKRLDNSPAALRNKILKAVIGIMGGKSLGLLGEKDRDKLKKYLLIALEDEEEDIQDAAVRGLGSLGGEDASKAVLELAAGLDPVRDQERLESMSAALARIGLTQALRDGLAKGWKEAMIAVRAFDRIGGIEASNLLMEGFADRDRDLKREIVKAIGRIGGEEAADFMMALLSTETDADVVKAAAGFVGVKLKLPQAAEALFALLDHPYDDVKEVALDACAALGGTDMIARFKALLGSDDWIKRLMGVYALGKMGPSEALEEIKLALEDESPDVRKAAVEAITADCLMPEDALAALLPRMSDENREVRLALIEALGKCNTAEFVGNLVQALGDEDDWVRIRALEALGARKDPAVIPHIVPLLEDHNKLVALKAVEALGKTGGRSAFRALMDMLSSDDPELQAAAEEALQGLNTESEHEA